MASLERANSAPRLRFMVALVPVLCGLTSHGNGNASITHYQVTPILNGVAQPVVPSVAITLPRIQALPALSMA